VCSAVSLWTIVSLSIRPKKIEHDAQSRPPFTPALETRKRPSITDTKTISNKQIQPKFAFDIAANLLHKI
jgi:hypothetical protein